MPNSSGDGLPPAVMSNHHNLGFAFIHSTLKGAEVMVRIRNPGTHTLVPYEEFIGMANEMIKACEEHDGVHD